MPDATLALKHDPGNEKATLRKLVALENLERFEAALHLVNAVLDNGERSAPTVFQYCVAARRRLRKNLARDREVAASEVKQMGKMVHDKQQLRVNFGCVPMAGTSRRWGWLNGHLDANVFFCVVGAFAVFEVGVCCRRRFR